MTGITSFVGVSHTGSSAAMGYAAAAVSQERKPTWPIVGDPSST